MFPDSERRYLVQSIRYVKQALISTGHGWLDAEPEIRRIKPHIYAVNEDGDRPEKRQYCQSHGIEYRVLRRLPKQGLPRRQSTDLRVLSDSYSRWDNHGRLAAGGSRPKTAEAPAKLPGRWR